MAVSRLPWTWPRSPPSQTEVSLRMPRPPGPQRSDPPSEVDENAAIATARARLLLTAAAEGPVKAEQARAAAAKTGARESPDASLSRSPRPKLSSSLSVAWTMSCSRTNHTEALARPRPRPSPSPPISATTVPTTLVIPSVLSAAASFKCPLTVSVMRLKMPLPS